MKSIVVKAIQFYCFVAFLPCYIGKTAEFVILCFKIRVVN